MIRRSSILGKPVAMLLLGRDATVTICRSHTTELPAIQVARIGVSSLVRTGTPRLISVRPNTATPGAMSSSDESRQHAPVNDPREEQR